MAPSEAFDNKEGWAIWVTRRGDDGIVGSSGDLFVRNRRQQSSIKGDVQYFFLAPVKISNYDKLGQFQAGLAFTTNPLAN